MTHEQILNELEHLAYNCGIAVRYEKGDFDGGLLRIKSRTAYCYQSTVGFPRAALPFWRRD